jgi:hypothetical protein
MDGEPSLCGRADEAEAGGDDRDLEGDRVDDEPSLGWPGRVHQTAQTGRLRRSGIIGRSRHALCVAGGRAPKGGARRIIKAGRRRKPNHCKTDHSDQQVDVDDSARIGARKIRNLSPKQEKLLAPRIDRSEVRI